MPKTRLEELAAEIGREVGMRKNVYPRWVAAGKITEAEAARRIENAVAVYELIRDLANAVQAFHQNADTAPLRQLVAKWRE